MNNSVMQYSKAATHTLLRSVTMMVFLSIGAMAIADNAAREGSFKGLSNHVTIGTATLIKEGESYRIELGSDFMFDGAPDPKVAFGKDGKFDAATLLEPLRANSGAQSYAVPGSINPEDYNEIYIWCEKYSVGLGVASIK